MKSSKWILDFDRGYVDGVYVFKNGKTHRDYEDNKIISKHKNYVVVQTNVNNVGKWEFHYSKDSIYSIYKGEKITYGNCTGGANVNEIPKLEMANMINRAKDTCKSLGFKEGNEKFADCALKLYSQSVELAAEQNKQVVMQPQSSGSNVITIYDPVRDSNALMQKGMKMLSGNCTLGIDC